MKRFMLVFMKDVHFQKYKCYYYKFNICFKMFLIDREILHMQRSVYYSNQSLQFMTRRNKPIGGSFSSKRSKSISQIVLTNFSKLQNFVVEMKVCYRINGFQEGRGRERLRYRFETFRTFFYFSQSPESYIELMLLRCRVLT